MDESKHVPLALDRHRRDILSSKDCDSSRPLPHGRPSSVLYRIVVAMHDERRNAGAGEPIEPASERELCTHPALCTVVNVTGDDHERHCALECGSNKILERLCCRVAQHYC
jgi:hypothetical protein